MSMQRCFLWMICYWCAISLRVVAIQAQEPDPIREPDPIWGREILFQPFDNKPFRQIAVPDWLQETLGCGYTLSVMNSDQRKQAAAHGVALSELGFVDPYYAYYESNLLKRRSPHVPMGRLEREIAEYKRLGVRVLGVYPPCLQAEVYELHPEWRRIATNTTEIPSIDLEQYPHGGMLCLLGPYGDFCIDVLEEILVQFPDVDAFSFDGLHSRTTTFHCVRRRFRFTTFELTSTPDMLSTGSHSNPREKNCR